MKKIDHVFIHVGTGKTGSTSIQMSLDLCRDTLAEQSHIYYAKGSSHGQLGSLFATNKAAYVFNRTQGRWDGDNVENGDTQYRKRLIEWMDAMPKGAKVVFSYEGLFGLDQAALTAMRDFFLQYANKVTAILYVRGPLSHAISAMSQRVKMARRSWGEDDVPIINFKNVIGRLVGAFGEEGVVVRKFDRATLSGGDVVKDLADIIGIQYSSLAQWFDNPLRMNESLTALGLLVGDMVHGKLADIGLKILPTDFNKRYSDLFSSLAGPKIKLTPQQAEQIRLKMRDNLAFLAERYGIEFLEKDEDFVVDSPLSSDQLELVGQLATVIARLIADHHAVRNARGQFVKMPASIKIDEGDTTQLDVHIKNTSPEVWYSFKGGRLFFQLDWYDESRKKLFKTDKVLFTGNTVPVRNVVTQAIELDPPTMMDLVCLRISLAQEGGNKFDKLGFEEWWIEVSVF